MRRYAAGATLAELAEAFDVSSHIIWRRVVEAGVERRPTGRRRTHADAEVIVRRYRDGASIVQLARERGMDRKAVHRMLVEAGVEIESRRRRSLPEGGRLPAFDGTTDLPTE